MSNIGTMLRYDNEQVPFDFIVEQYSTSFKLRKFIRDGYTVWEYASFPINNHYVAIDCSSNGSILISIKSTGCRNKLPTTHMLVSVSDPKHYKKLDMINSFLDSCFDLINSLKDK